MCHIELPRSGTRRGRRGTWFVLVHCVLEQEEAEWDPRRKVQAEVIRTGL
jgi:hypothetical protein